MKCFVVLAALMAVACADPGLPLLARGALPVNAYAGAYGYGAVRPYLGLRGVAAAPAVVKSAVVAPVAVAAPVVKAAPVPVIAKAAPVPAVPSTVATQYHKGDELGNYEYGYANINSAKSERGNAYQGVEGSYSYVDSYGLPQQVNYVADALGFRASGTNFPATAATLGLNRLHKRAIAPIAPIAAVGVPAAIAPAALPANLVHSALPIGAYAPTGAIGYASPIVSPPSAREAIKTTIQNNPGFAVSYTVA